MEHESREKQTQIEFRRRKLIPGVEKSANPSPAAMKNAEAAVDEGSKSSVASPTPEKFDRRLSKGKELDTSPIQGILSKSLVPEITFKSAELPEKLKTLADLFDRMCTSIRLLGLKKRLQTFQNICTQVEILSKRKFSYAHLAQMKYVFPDAIKIERVLIHDEKTLCMKQDLKIIVLFDIMGYPSYPGQSIWMALGHAFRVRLLEHLNVNQDAEIPEAVLPEPFNQRNDINYLESLPVRSFTDSSQPASVELDSFSSASHFPSSFRKHFCQKVIVPEAERTKILASTSPSAIADEDGVESNKKFDITAPKDSISSPPVIRSLSEAICIRSPDKLRKRTPEKGVSSAYDMITKLIDTPVTSIGPQSCHSTPANDDQITVDAILETPALQTPKRPLQSPIEMSVSTNEKSANEPKSTPSARRTLIFSPLKMEIINSKLDFDTAELTEVHERFSNESLSDKRSICGQETNQACDATPRITEAQKLTQPNPEKRQAILNCLPSMFDTIRMDLIRQIRELEGQVEERKEWAQQKAMQAARKLSGDLHELRVLRMEREENQRAIKGKQVLEESTLKRLSEMESALKKASGQVDRANAAVKKLEIENAEIRAEMEASKLSASESGAACMEVSKREKKCLKKLAAWEKQKEKMQEEVTEKRKKIILVQQQLAEMQEATKQVEIKWRQEVKEREESLSALEEERRAKDAAEANCKKRQEGLRQKIEIDFQRYKDDIHRLEEELSRRREVASTARLIQSVDADALKPLAESNPKILLPEQRESRQKSNHRICWLCREDEVSVVFLPCAHQVLCYGCNESHRQKGSLACPVCKKHIEERIHVYGTSS